MELSNTCVHHGVRREPDYINPSFLVNLQTRNLLPSVMRIQDIQAEHELLTSQIQVQSLFVESNTEKIAYF